MPRKLPRKTIRTAPCTVKASMLLACVSTAVSLVTAATIRARPTSFDRQQLRMPYLVHKANANFMNDRFDLGSRRDGDVGLGLDEQKKCNQKERRSPQSRTALQTGIDGTKNRRSADASESGHEQQLRQRAVHFAANELKEGHMSSVYTSTKCRCRPSKLRCCRIRQTTSVNSGEAIRHGVMGRSEVGQATLQMEW